MEDFIFSREYKEFLEEEFKKQKRPLFERICKKLCIVQIKCPKNYRERIEKANFVAGLELSADEVFTAAFIAFLLAFLVALPLFLLFTSPFSIFFLALPLLVFFNFLSYPNFYANVVRVKAGDEMVDIILYMSIYLMTSPILEGAFFFAAKNCSGPLGQDFRKITWDLCIGVYRTLDEAINVYIPKWSEWNKYFVRALRTFSFIEVTPRLEKKLEIIREALRIVLEGSYKDMKKFAKGMQRPCQFINAFGVILPTFGLVLFPLASIFLAGGVSNLLMAMGYLFILPSTLFFYIYKTLSLRPCAFVRKKQWLKPDKHIKIRSIKVRISFISLAIALVALPAILHYTQMALDYYTIHKIYSQEDAKKIWTEKCLKSYGSETLFTSTLIAMTLPIGIGFSLGSYFYLRSYRKRKKETFIKNLEQEFELALRELGTLLEKGLPIETAIYNLLERYRRLDLQNTTSYQFFEKIAKNMSAGMTFDDALLDNKVGVLRNYPSQRIFEIMDTLRKAIKKGIHEAGVICKNISHFLGYLRKTEELVNDLLHDTISSITLYSSFIIPFLCGVIASVSTFMIIMLQNIVKILERIESKIIGGIAAKSLEKLSETFIELHNVMPATLFMLIISIYVIEMLIILGFFINGIKEGFDDISRDYIIGKLLMKGTLFYVFVVIIGIYVIMPLAT